MKVHRRLVRNADDLVRCLPIELEVELGLGPTVAPVAERFEFAPTQAPLSERDTLDGDAHARRLPGDTTPLRDCVGRGDDAARDEAWPPFVLAREHKYRIALGNTLATI